MDKAKRILIVLILLLTFTSSACSLSQNIPFLASQTPTPTITPTPTNTPKPTFTPTPTPTPTRTPIPSSPIEQADWYLSIGDWPQAIIAYQSIVNNPENPSAEIAAALLGKGKAYFQEQNYPEALLALREVVNSYPSSGAIPHTHYFLARVYSALERYPEAAENYQLYLQLQPDAIPTYILIWLGDTYFAAGNYLSAYESYNQAASDPGILSLDTIQLKMAQSLSASGDYQNALDLYEQIYQSTANDYTKAEINWLRGQIYYLLGEDGYAQLYFYDSVEHFPYSYYTYIGLIDLVESGFPVSEYDRGLIDFYAGQDGLAVAAFDRFLLNSGEHESSVHYFKGLSLRNIDAYEEAIDAWNTLIIEHTPAEKHWADAWEQIGYTQWAYLEDYEAAIQTFLSFAVQVPDHEQAPDFLFYAAQVAERDGQLLRAAEIWESIRTAYPAAPISPRAIFLAGITYYRLQEYSKALQAFQVAFEYASDVQSKSAALYWVGKTHQTLNDSSSARSVWEQTILIDPTGYYSERAKDQILGREPFQIPINYDFYFDPEKEKSLAESWMRNQFLLPDTTDFESLGSLEQNPKLLRGTALWELGELELARTEFESLRLDIQDEPLSNYILANYLIELGLFRTGIICIQQLLHLGQLSGAGSLTAPAYFSYLRFGLYYKDLIVPVASRNGIHPLLAFSIIRQESLYEGFVSSSAGARGLMQIMPATGQGIQNNLNWPVDYNSDDLYRPYVNVTFGISYLTEMMGYLNNDIYAALAGYNAGPGNSSIWQSLANNDQDLFLEIIRYQETRNYIRGIYEIYTIYRNIYGN